MEKEIIKRIPTGLEKYLGVGEMILPSEEAVLNELKALNNIGLTSIPILRKNIAEKFSVATACPKTTLSTLRKLINDGDERAFRVVNGKGELITKDQEVQADYLKNENFHLDRSGKKIKVQNFKSYLQ